ncbi:hypothetical protein [Legionella sp. km772]|uniref:type IV pilus modification PilV family protein n=1 Tax=Legionella sp. km772 TaxID=2498111 RepID=UPI000F8EAD6A|nr:hypothetical protein [Legionella sp. km772]RUR06469.1 hypothetical protein ELY15_13175 [Legionella sp. km772]
MDNHKGFSLIEILLSFLLLTASLVFLLDLYGVGLGFFQQTLQNAQASSLLDSVEETLIVTEQLRPSITSDYELRLVNNSTGLKLELLLKKQGYLLTRRYATI